MATQGGGQRELCAPAVRGAGDPGAVDQHLQPCSVAALGPCRGCAGAGGAGDGVRPMAVRGSLLCLLPPALAPTTGLIIETFLEWGM